MKTFFLLISICLIYLTSLSQTNPSNFIRDIKTYNSYQNNDSLHFAISPKFRVEKSKEQGFSQKFQKFSLSTQQKDSLDLSANRMVPEFRMPVASGGSFTENMPVAVPDSSVHYYLKIKKIDGVNPLEKSWRRK